MQAAVSRQVTLPAGYSIAWSGQFEYLERAKSRLAGVVPATHLIIEPAARNTAPAIGLAAVEVSRSDPAATLVVLPSDHHIAQPAAFRDALRTAIRVAQGGYLVTPRLSVGTASPESIYEARFAGKIRAASPRPEAGECEIELPLPPQVISLADLTINAAGEPGETVALRDGKLVWRGALAAEPTPLDVAYTAVGKGLYEL